MAVTAGILLLIAGTCLSLASMRELTRANNGRLLPVWRKPPETPGRVIALRAFGAGATVYGAALADDVLKFWVVIAVVVALGLPLIVLGRHNRRVLRSH